MIILVQAVKIYATSIYTNMGNYKGHGDIKFVPRCAADEMEKCLRSSNAWKKNPAEMEKLWSSVKCPMYSLDEGTEYLGFKGKVIERKESSLIVSVNIIMLFISSPRA